MSVTQVYGLALHPQDDNLCVHTPNFYIDKLGKIHKIPIIMKTVKPILNHCLCLRRGS
jgi:hypothetical protein